MSSVSQGQISTILDDLMRQGVVVERRSKGVRRVVFPDGSNVQVHSSPSDTNWYHNVRRATIKAGLIWPGEDRARVKAVIKEKNGRKTVEEFTLEYGGYASGPVSQEVRDNIAQLLTGKSQTRVPELIAQTKLSSPTVTKALLRLGWLQRSELVAEPIVRQDGSTSGTRRAYWAPAPQSMLEKVTFKGVPNAKPIVTVAKPEDRPAEPEPEAEAATVVTESPKQNEWFEEAARQEARAVEAERLAGEYKAEIDRLKSVPEPVVTPTVDNSWAADLSDLPRDTTIAEYTKIASSMGLTAQVRLSRNS